MTSISKTSSSHQNNVLLISGIASFIGASFLGFPIVETLKQTVMEIDPLHRLKTTWWLQVYMFLLPLGMTFLLLASFHNYSYWAWFPVLAFLTVPLTLNYVIQIMFDLEELYTAPAAFGIRGGMIALGIYMTIRSICSSNKPSALYHFIAQCCFALAAWNCCALGSFVAWAAHPEYGEFGQLKRDQLAAIQLYFILGFAIQAIAYRMDNDSNQKSRVFRRKRTNEEESR